MALVFNLGFQLFIPSIYNHFCVLTLYPVFLLSSLICTVVCEFFGIFYDDNYVICKQKWSYFFHSNLHAFKFFLLLYCTDQDFQHLVYYFAIVTIFKFLAFESDTHFHFTLGFVVMQSVLLRYFPVWTTNPILSLTLTGKEQNKMPLKYNTLLLGKTEAN